MIPGRCTLILRAFTLFRKRQLKPRGSFNPPFLYLQLLVLLCHLTSLAHYAPSPTPLDKRPVTARPQPSCCMSDLQEMLGGGKNWRACPQFSSIVWTKWVKLGCTSPNMGTQSHGNDILVMPNCFPWCVVIVWPVEAGVGLQAGKTLSAYQAPYMHIHVHKYRYLTTQQLHSTIILHLHIAIPSYLKIAVNGILTTE